MRPSENAAGRIRAALSWLICLVLAGGLSPVLAQDHTGHVSVEHPSRPAAWTSQPMLQATGRPGQRGGVPFAVSGFTADSLVLFAPENPQQGLHQTIRQGRWLVAAGIGSEGGLHWLMAETRTAGHVIRASTAWSFPGKGISPAKLLETTAGGLDLRPLRLPQLGAYREGSRWGFRLTRDGLPLAGHEVLLETENGTRQTFLSDSAGEVSVLLPHDYPADGIDPELGAARTRKAYLLSATLALDGVRHTTTFSNFYTPDLLRERSLGWGAGFAVFGMLLALPLLRRKEKKA